MTSLLPLALIVIGTTGPGVDIPHESNDVYRVIIGDGVVLDGKRVVLDPPRLSEGRSADEEQRVLEEIAGGERALADLLRDSVTAPFILKVRDEETEHGKIRHADLTFVVHADLATVKPEQAARESDGKSVEVANMKLSTSMLDDATLQQLGLPDEHKTRWYARSSAEMLDRIRVETTNRIVVTREKRSLVIASMTDREFHAVAKHPNSWQTLPRRGSEAGPVVSYDGSVSFARITELVGRPGVLVVEAKVAFFEPKEWFDGAPILRSKFAPIAQDQIRRLRRELKKSED